MDTVQRERAKTSTAVGSKMTWLVNTKVSWRYSENRLRLRSLFLCPGLVERLYAPSWLRSRLDLTLLSSSVEPASFHMRIA